MPKRHSTPLRLEALDARVVPAVGVTRSGAGQVVIQGGAADDVATVTQNDQQIVVTLNGAATTFDRAKVHGILFRGEAGND